MYVLLINGFDIKHGRFIEYGFSVTAFVSKSMLELPPLRGDRGDIALLNKAELWPLKILPAADGLADGFYGNLLSVNWPQAKKLLKHRAGKKNMRLSYRITSIFTNIICKLFGKRRVAGLARMMSKLAEGEINPSILK